MIFSYFSNSSWQFDKHHSSKSGVHKPSLDAKHHSLFWCIDNVQNLGWKVEGISVGGSCFSPPILSPTFTLMDWIYHYPAIFIFTSKYMEVYPAPPQKKKHVQDAWYFLTWLAGISPFSIGFLHLQSGSILQPAMLVDPRV